MKVLTEKKAEEFLKKEGFHVIDTKVVRNFSHLESALLGVKFPVVMKVASSKIIHKTLVNGIRVGIKNYDQALKAFDELMDIKDAEGVLIQSQVKGKELFFGLKKTKDFGHVIGFGRGGEKVEEKKRVEFRVCNVKGFEKLSKRHAVRKVLKRLCKLVEKYPKIESLDINPLILSRKGAIIVDAQMFFE